MLLLSIITTTKQGMNECRLWGVRARQNATMVRPSDYATNNSIVVAAIETFPLYTHTHTKKITMQCNRHSTIETSSNGKEKRMIKVVDGKHKEWPLSLIFMVLIPMSFVVRWGSGRFVLHGWCGYCVRTSLKGADFLVLLILSKFKLLI